jgi:hypothetical protein
LGRPVERLLSLRQPSRLKARFIAIWRYLALVLLLPTVCVAQDFSDYRRMSLDDVFEQWDNTTKTNDAGVSIMAPQKIKFVATYISAPKLCSTNELEVVLLMIGVADWLKQTPVTHCLEFSSDKGRKVIAYVQDVIVPGIEADARPNGQIEIFAELVAYKVNVDRSRNTPMLLVNRLELLQ